MTSGYNLSPDDRALLVDALELLQADLTRFIVDEENWLDNARLRGVPSKVRHEAMELSAKKRAMLNRAANLESLLR